MFKKKIYISDLIIYKYFNKLIFTNQLGTLTLDLTQFNLKNYIFFVDKKTKTLNINFFKLNHESIKLKNYPNYKQSLKKIEKIILNLTRGYNKKLNLHGTGYKAQVNNNNLILRLGYSHDIIYAIPKSVFITCLTPTQIFVWGFDKQKVHQVSYKIYSFKKPDVYKGKGVCFANQILNLKEAKKK